MKQLAKFEQDLGPDSKVGASLGVEGTNLKAEISITYPIAKVVEPVMGVVDSLVDKLEALIPGDQKAMAAAAKADAREAIVKALSEQL